MIAATNKIHNAPIVGVLRLSETKLKCLGICFFRAPINGILILNHLNDQKHLIPYPIEAKGVTVIAVVVFQIHDLEYPQQIPLRLPSVDNATPTGAIQARDGKALLAKVIATAGDARNSSFVISVKQAILTKMYNIPQNRMDAEQDTRNE